MANTTNLNLVKPAGTDKALVSVINANSDKIDAFAGTTNQALAHFTATTPSAITDFNSAITPGYYRAGLTVENAPTSGYWAVSVLPFSSGDLAQLALEVNLRKAYIRTLHDSTTWTTWQQLALKSDVPETKSWTGGAGMISYGTWLCGGQLVLTGGSSGSAECALCLFTIIGNVYRLTEIKKTSNASFIYNANGVFGVQVNSSYDNVQMFAIRLA